MARRTCMTGVALLLILPASAFAQDCSSQLIEKFMAGWSNDMSTLMTVFTDDIVYEDTTVHEVIHGKNELKKFAQDFFTAFPDVHFVSAPPAPVQSGDRAAVVWRMTGTQKGDMPGMPASNKAMDVVGVSMMQCVDGKIARNTDYWDMATMMRQLRFLPPPPK